MGGQTLTLDDYRRQFPAAGRALALHDALRPLLDESPDLPQPMPSLDAATIEQAWQSGQPIVSRLSLGPSAEPLRQILRRVTEQMLRQLPSLGPLETLVDRQRLNDM